MKILHIVHWPRTGITSLLDSLFDVFDASTVHYLFIVDARAEDLEPFAGKVAGMGCGGGSLFGAAVALINMVKTVAPDIVHTHSFTPSVMAALLCGDVPHVRTFHSEYPYFSSAQLISRLKRQFESWALKRSKASIVCVSDGVQRTLPYSFEASRVCTIKNGLPIEKIVALARSGLSRHDAWGDAASKVIIASVGRLEHQKGYDVLIESMLAIPAKIRATLLLVLVGEGSKREELEQIIRSNDLGNVVRLLGYQDNPYQFLSVADIYVCSSRYEGYGLSLAEAMVLGLPVATTRVSGVPQMIVDGETGVVIDDLTPDDVAKSLLKLVESKTFANNIALAGQQFARDEMDVKAVADAHVTLYRGILNA